MRRIIIGLVVTLGAVFFAAPVPAHAAASATGSTPGIAITPAKQDRVLGPTEKSVNITVQLSNDTDRPLKFDIRSSDFTALNQTGGLAFLGTDIARVSNGHGLSGILRFNSPQLTVDAHKTALVTAHIDDVSKLAPGGHYSAIIAQVVPDANAPNGNKVAINQAVSSLVFIETAGSGSKTLKLLRPSVPKLSFALPETVNTVFEATGNTQTMPRGIITVSRGSHEVQRGIINASSSLVLPGSSRLFAVSMTGSRHPFLSGKYTLSVQYRYEGSLGISRYEASFWYVNILGMLALAAGLVLAVIVGLFLRRYWGSFAPLVRRKR